MADTDAGQDYERGDEAPGTDGTAAGSGPDTVALIDRSGAVTYAELQDRARRVRGGLIAEGVRPGDAVLIVAANERESAAAYRAVTGLGAVAVMSQVGAGERELAAARRLTRPAMALLSPPATGAGIPVGAGLRTLPIAELAGPPAEPAAAARLDDPCLVVFTSGTTAMPKGVVHSGRSLAAAAACFQAILQLGPDDRFFVISPLASITGVLQALEVAPLVGGSAVLEQGLTGEASLDYLIETSATAYGGPDVVLSRLMAEAARRGVGLPLRVAALGGTMLRSDLLRQAEFDFGIRVVRVYGSSEVPCSTGTRPDEPAEVRLADEGRPGPHVEIDIAADGEILVRGPHMFLGYCGATEEAGHPTGRWFRTGDEGSLIDGRLRVTGRIKDIAIRNGKKISLAEVDEAFRAASGVSDCAAFLVPDAATGERVVVAVHLPGGAALDVPSVLGAMERAGLARYKLPESVVARDEPLPLTDTGKVARRSLREAGRVLWRSGRLDPPS